MKKYIVFSMIFALVLGAFIINVKLTNATAGYSVEYKLSGCKAGDKFSRKTGERCVEVSPVKECLPGDLFSAYTGKPCEVAIEKYVVISGVKGPQYLDVNQEGTWEVKAYNKDGGDLSYSVYWGDESSLAKPTAAEDLSFRSSQQSATFTHSYSKAGKYSPVFYVTSENTIRCIQAPCPPNGGSAKTSLTVKVGDYAEYYKEYDKKYYDKSAVQILKQNSRGEKVLELQEYLTKKGYDVGNIDGVFGARVRAAVLKLQADKKLKIDGIVGPEVWFVLGL